MEAETGTDAPRPPAALFRRGAADAHILERGHVPYGVVPEIGFQRVQITGARHSVSYGVTVLRCYGVTVLRCYGVTVL